METAIAEEEEWAREVGGFDDFDGDEEEPGQGTHPAPVAALARILKAAASHASFAAQVDVPAFPPVISVDGLGVLPLPLVPFAADALPRPHLSASKFGKGTETLLDPAVRTSLEAPPAVQRILNPEWDAAIQVSARALADALGVNSNVLVEAQLWRLILYEPGSFFRPHRDSEKAPGMFATLVVQLPCAEEQRGGALVGTHNGTTKRFRVADPVRALRPSGFGFFADCTHEVELLESGRRLVLVYNLVRRGAGAVPSAPAGPTHDAAVTSLSCIARSMAERGKHACLLVPLEHEYSAASFGHLGAAALKGKDAAA
ncbi:hypothetical protein DFJ74DRAFT_610046 [Hyaloraphidium curvatum]|nr:hypothetical protein DFJ74DRAFT_610046 [Hyaloraphidium curvatum]